MVITIVIICFLIVLIPIIYKYTSNEVWDFGWLHSAKPAFVYYPTNEKEILRLINDYPHHQFSLAGSKYSHGGHTMLNNAIYLDFKNYNQIINFDINQEIITVQAGTTWEQIISYLDQFNYSVSEMQSYSNFTVGGSISVNCHGRGTIYGTLADCIHTMQVITMEGKVLLINDHQYSDLFKAIIGGYGGIAIISEATLKVTNNYPIERKITITDGLDLCPIMKKIISDPDLVFYNANIYPKNENKIVHICWYRSQLPLTCHHRLQSKKQVYWFEMIGEQILRRNDFFKRLRGKLEPYILCNHAVVWRNYEMSYDVNALQPLMKFPTTTILQEYFLPIENIHKFLYFFWEVVNYYKVNLLNLSIRYVKKTSIPLLNYVPNDRLALVLYINIGNNQMCVNYMKKWTRLLIDRIIEYGGSYYLPYLPLATKSQFQLAYPLFFIYLKIKKKYDPLNRLSSQFLKYYLT